MRRWRWVICMVAMGAMAAADVGRPAPLTRNPPVRAVVDQGVWSYHAPHVLPNGHVAVVRWFGYYADRYDVDADTVINSFWPPIAEGWPVCRPTIVLSGNEQRLVIYPGQTTPVLPTWVYDVGSARLLAALAMPSRADAPSLREWPSLSLEWPPQARRSWSTPPVAISDAGDRVMVVTDWPRRPTTTSPKGNCQVWDVPSGRCLLDTTSGEEPRLASNGRALVESSARWDLSTSPPTKVLERNSPWDGWVDSSDGRWRSGGNSDGAWIAPLTAGGAGPRRSLPVGNVMRPLRFSADGRFLWLSRGKPWGAIWDTQRERLLGLQSVDNNEYSYGPPPAVSADGGLVALLCESGQSWRLHRWDTASDQRRQTELPSITPRPGRPLNGTYALAVDSVVWHSGGCSVSFHWSPLDASARWPDQVSDALSPVTFADWWAAEPGQRGGWAISGRRQPPPEVGWPSTWWPDDRGLGVSPSPDWRWALAPGQDRVARLYRLWRQGDPGPANQPPKLMASISYFGQDNWVAWVPAGYITGTDRGIQRLAWADRDSQPTRFWPATAWRRQLERPALFRCLIAADGDLDRAIALARQ